MESIVEYVAKKAGEMPEKIAVIVDDVETTYGQLYRMCQKYAEILKKSGVSHGDVIVTRASQDLAYVVIYLSIHLAGGVVCSVENNVFSNILLEIADKMRADFVLETGLRAAGYRCLDRNVVDEVIRLADRISYDNATGIELSFPKKDDLADILFTTGTTGTSKGVELTHGALVATAENLIFGCKYAEDTVLIAPGPLNHANAIRKLFTTFVNGSSIIILNGMKNLKKFFDALNYGKGKIACCLPPASIRTLFVLTGDEIGKYIDVIDFIESATSPLPEHDKQKLIELLPKTRLYNNYGSSESASVCILEYSKYKNLIGCIGKAMPNSNVFVVDDDKLEIKSSKDNPGLIACEGKVNMSGYRGEPDLTAEVLKNGVVYTNDIGYIEDEFVYIIGRKGDVINVGGLKVAPTEVENEALDYGGVKDCICIAVPDNIVGNSLKILLVVEDENSFDKKEFVSFMGKRLEAYKVPHKIEFVESVRRTYNGKIDRKSYR